MDVEKKIRGVDAKFDMGLRMEELSFVVAAVKKHNVVAINDSDLRRAVENIVMKFRANPLASEAASQAQQVALAANQACAVCGGSMDQITLMGDIPAYFCPTHRVAQPMVRQVSEQD